jgi:ubiquinone/menaquinone biosynthesis C-methylase UbiE
MNKLDNFQYVEYWKSIHVETADEYAAVCHPDKPSYFNRFYDRIQKYAVEKCLKYAGISLADSKLLDIGCGRGRWLSYFQQNHKAYTVGIDLSEEAVSACRSKELEAVVGSVTQLPFESNAFDVVTSITVLLHLPFDLKPLAIAEIARVTKPCGKAILMESTHDDDAPHVYSWSVEKWQKEFEKHDMKLSFCSAHQFTLFNRYIPSIRILRPILDFVKIYLDYPLEYVLMNLYAGRTSKLSMQHVMVFEKLPKY